MQLCENSEKLVSVQHAYSAPQQTLKVDLFFRGDLDAIKRITVEFCEDAFNNGIEAQLPVEGTIPRGWVPYEFEDTNEGYDLAKNTLFSPIEKNDKNLAEGKELYGVYCAVCHGSKGDGQGILMKREKFLGIPSYADRDITEGSTYHVLMYGKNLMGSHASQVDSKERWQISQYVLSLREKLVK